MKYGLTEKQLNSILNSCKQFKEIEEVILFGSRAMNTFKPTSDIDLALKGNITLHTISNLQAQLEELNIIYSFDVINYHSLNTPEFLEHIDQYGIRIYLKGWEETNLVNQLESLIDYRGKTPKKSDKGILTLSAKSVKMGKIDYNQAYYISPETYKTFMVRGFPKTGDILMTTEAPLGCIAKLDRDDVGIAQRLLTLRGKKNILDNDFLMYYLISPRGQFELLSRASGSTVSGIKRSEFIKVNIFLPNYTEQKAIANILTAFDDKIELLQAQNNTLEQTAQTIFKEWFGKYQLGDELPEGWRVGKLQNIAFHVKENIKPFNNPDIEYNHFSLPAFDNGLNPIKEKGINIKSNKYKVIDDCFLVSKLNPFTPRIWTVYKSSEKDICSTEFQVVKPNKKDLFSLIHCLLNSDIFTKELTQKIKGTSSSHQRVNPKDIFDVSVIIPCELGLFNFDKTVKPLILKKGINSQQIQTLKQSRDTLLPKLMSGELRVKM